MAATGTPTPNIGLRIPLGTDPASVDDINYNSNLIDAKLGAVGDDSVQDQIDDLNSNLTAITSSLNNVQAGRVTNIDIAANSQAEITVTMPRNYNGGDQYVAVANLEYYSAAQSYSACLIRSKSAYNFVIRIFNNSSNAVENAALDWITIGVTP